MANAKTKTFKLFGANEIVKESANLSKYLTTAGPARVQAYLLSEMVLLDNPQHRNPTRLCAFLRNIKGGMARSNAIHAWVQRFCNVEFVKADQRNAAGDEYRMKPIRKEVDAKLAFEAAQATMWTSCKADTEAKDYLLEKSAKSFLTSAFKNGLTMEDIEAAIEKVKTDAQLEANKAIKRAQAKASTVGVAITVGK